MNDPNENRPGYKKTKVGWIPDEWECRRGAEISTLISKGASPNWQGFDYTTSGMLFVTSENVRDGYLDVSRPKFLPLEFNNKIKRTQIRVGDVLINLVGASIGRSCLVNEDLGVANVNQAVAVVRVSETVNHKFIAAYLQAPSTIRRILHMQVDAARPNISLGDLNDFLFAMPPPPEQEQCVEVLESWDKTIRGLRELIVAKKRRKKGLMQQLLSGKRRLPGFAGKWKERRLGDLFTERREIGRCDLPLLAITGSKGIVPAADLDRKDASNQDKSKYLRICPGDIGYNTMRMWQGVNAVSPLEGIVSPAYTICTPKEDTHVGFMGHFFKYQPVVHQFWRNSQGLSMIRSV